MDVFFSGATYYIEVFSERYHSQIEKALERYNELLAMHKGATVKETVSSKQSEASTND